MTNIDLSPILWRLLETSNSPNFELNGEYIRDKKTGKSFERLTHQGYLERISLQLEELNSELAQISDGEPIFLEGNGKAIFSTISKKRKAEAYVVTMGKKIRIFNYLDGWPKRLVLPTGKQLVYGAREEVHHSLFDYKPNYSFWSYTDSHPISITWAVKRLWNLRYLGDVQDDMECWFDFDTDKREPYFDEVPSLYVGYNAIDRKRKDKRYVIGHLSSKIFEEVMNFLKKGG